MPRLSLLRVGLLLSLLTTGTIYHAYMLKKQFFPTCVYLLSSSLSMLVMVCFAIYSMVLLANLLKVILFGSLRPAEVDHLHEYGWMTISESLLAMTIFRSEFDARFAIVFAGLILVKGFHWIIRDRVDYMEQAMRLPEQYHVKIATSLYLLAATDLMGAVFFISDVSSRGPSMSIMLANEFCLMMVSVAATATRYFLNLNDIRRGEPWENRSVALFYMDFIFDLLKLLIYLFYFAVIVTYYGLPIHIIRDLYVTFRSFVIRINDIVKYRQATADMDRKYPKATEQELADAVDRVCIICREEMVVEADGPRRLPCGHIFHMRCLRSWLERQQACPTCRKSVITQQPPVPEPQYPGNMVRPIQNQAEGRVYQPGAEIYMRPDDLVQLEDGRFVIRETKDTDNPMYAERVASTSYLSVSRPSSTLSSAASTIELEVVRNRSLETLEDQIQALNEVNKEIESLLSKAQNIKDIIEKGKEKDNSDIQ